jgi:hypothetical protein
MAGLQLRLCFSLRMNYPDIDDAPLPFEIYTDEELEQMQIEQEQDDWERSIPTPADRNPNLK